MVLMAMAAALLISSLVLSWNDGETLNSTMAACLKASGVTTEGYTKRAYSADGAQTFDLVNVTCNLDVIRSIPTGLSPEAAAVGAAYAKQQAGHAWLKWLALIVAAVGVTQFFVTRPQSVPSPVAEQRAVGSHTADMTILRWVRGFFGLIAGWQVVGLLPLLGWLGSLDQVTGENLAQVFIKLVVLLVAYGIFVGMKKLINWIHSRRFGEPHPAMVSRWSL
jgi:hypothetical protein